MYRYSTKCEKILKQHPNSAGYLSVHISNKVVTKTALVHRLVAQTFISNPNNYNVVDQINEIKTDNRAENLRWCTNQDNSNYVYENGRGTNRVILQYDEKLNLINKYSSLGEAARRNDLDKANIFAACKGTANTANGYIWRYEEEAITTRTYSIDNARGNRKAVVHLDKDGREIAKYISITEAVKATELSPSGIWMVCGGKQNSAKGTYWRFLEEGESLEVVERKIRIIRIKK